MRCREVVGLVSQDAHVFDSTLEENLRLARRGASTEELRAALAAVRLLDWTEGLPDGLSTEVGERGARMSGGQRQRLAIARALLADFPRAHPRRARRASRHANGGRDRRRPAGVTRERATLLITHRLAGLEEVDEVLVLDRGRGDRARHPRRAARARRALRGAVAARERLASVRRSARPRTVTGLPRPV